MNSRPGASPGFSLIEILLCLAILVVCILPLTDLVSTTARGTRVTRDYLVAYNLAQMVFEQIVSAATIDANDSFDKVTRYNTPATARGPTGCPGVSIGKLALEAGETIMPDGGEPRFDPATGDKDYASLFANYSYTVDVAKAPSAADTVVTTDAKAALARVNVKVYWKNPQGECQSLTYSDYIARRKY